MKRIATIAILIIACTTALLLFFAVPLAKHFLHLPNPVLPAITSSSHKARIDQISCWMQLAIIAAEDHRYYEHHGIDSLGVLRATIDNIRAERMREGASTITQQLAKVTFLNQNDWTAQRKISQIVLAFEIEQRYPKDKILEAYLNTVYFGRGAYGIQDASKTYFGVRASQLSIAQAAFLAGIVREPAVLGSPAHMKEAIERQHDVINNMQECGSITDGQAKAAKRQPLLFARR